MFFLFLIIIYDDYFLLCKPVGYIFNISCHFTNKCGKILLIDVRRDINESNI